MRALNDGGKSVCSFDVGFESKVVLGKCACGEESCVLFVRGGMECGLLAA
jgi:hypothetical protein